MDPASQERSTVYVRTKPLAIPISGTDKLSGLVSVPDRFESGKGPVLLLAHGAGNDMTNPLLAAVSEGLAERNILVCRFNFPYKQAGKKAPDPAAVLEKSYRRVIAYLSGHRFYQPSGLFLGGKSLGGRIASRIVADGINADGLIFLGYPLHPAGKPEELRTAHWDRIDCPMLFFAGTRDPLCSIPLLITATADRPNTRLEIIDGGDHSFKTPKAQGTTVDEVTARIIRDAAEWIDKICRG
jgi:uncharacterized protein